MFLGLNRIFSNIKGYYQGINGATLTGAIDVIVVEQPDGSYKSTPFHVRFGKIGILRPSEKTVDITVNGETITDLEMRLGSSGEAYFEINVEGDVLLTSSNFKTQENIFSADEENMDIANSNSKNRYPRSSSLSETDHVDDKMLKILPTVAALVDSTASVNDILMTDSSRPITSTGCKSDTELDASAKKDSTIVAGMHDDLNWEWGQLPQVKRASFSSELLTSPSIPPRSSLKEYIVETPLPSPPPSTNIITTTTTTTTATSTTQVNTTVHHELHSHEGIYLSELVDAVGKDPALTDLYLYGSPSSKQNMPQDLSDPGYRSDSESADKTMKKLPTQCNDNGDFMLSLCGGLDGRHEPSLDWFLKHRVQESEFVRDPMSILNHPDLIIRWEDRYYTWPAFSAMMISAAAYQMPLQENDLSRLNISKPVLSSNSSPRKSSGSSSTSNNTRTTRSGFRNWFWGSRSNPPLGIDKNDMDTEANDIGHDTTNDPGNDDSTAAKLTELSHGSLDWHSDGEVDNMMPTFDSSELIPNPRRDSMPDFQLPQSTPKKNKTIRLSSDHLKKLNLHEGANETIFSVTTKYQGTCRCACYIYLWKWTDRIIVSDIDGTITKSDVLGNIFSLVGPYWAQSGIATLYNGITANDYRFMYLTARAIGQAAITRNYLRELRQDGLGLPDGPLLMSPSSLFQAFQMEVIKKRPEEFKISCLTDVRSLFPEDQLPLYAGFGNKQTDVVTYKSVGMDLHRIFTVNPQGQLRHELPGHRVAVSYSTLGNIVDLYFPPVQHLIGAEKYSQFAYWNHPVPSLDEMDLDHVKK